LSEGCIIHARKIEKSIVGIRSRIGEKTIINKSILMGADYYETLLEILNTESTPIGIGKNCFIEQAILDKNCRIGDDVTIIGDASLADTETESYCIVDGIVVVKKGAIIASGTKIGKIN